MASVLGSACIGQTALKSTPCWNTQSEKRHCSFARSLSLNFHGPLSNHRNTQSLCTFRAQDISGSYEQQQEYGAADENLGFMERLAHAWEILFPPPYVEKQSISNAEIAKQRLKMILISDRCSITDDAKKKIVDNIVGALADFVEIESEEKVQLNVLADPDLGTVYSVSVPVRRVKPEYQEFSKELQNFEYQTGENDNQIRTVGIRFDNPSFES